MKFLSIFAALALPCSISLSAAPNWAKRVNVPKTGALKTISPTHLSYEFSWNGKLKAGNLDLTFGKKDPRYPKHFLAQGWGGSTGWASTLFPFQFNYIGFLSPSTYRPLLFVGNETDKRRTVNYEFRFQKSKVTGTKKKIRKDGKPNSTTKKTISHPHLLDLFSGLLQIRSLPLKKGDQHTMAFVPVGTAYLANVKVLGREQHLGRNAIKMSISMEKVDDDLKIVEYKKLKSAHVWISDDEWRIPLEVRAKVWVGDVRMTLTGQKAL